MTHAWIVSNESRTPTTTGMPRDCGSVLVWAMLFAIIASAMIVSHATYVAATRGSMGVRAEHVDLSHSFARSGLTDALQWYQKQPTQPVAAFEPALDPHGDPPRLDTIDPLVGLVREFEVRGTLWARYEVRHTETFDVSSARGLDTPGSVWDVGSRGYLFERNEAGVAFDEEPNRVVASSYVRTEIQGLAFTPPAPAAIVVGRPEDLAVGPNAVIDGHGAPAVAYPSGAALAPTVAAQLPGGAVAVVGYDDSSQRVLGGSLGRVGSLSDYVVDAGPPSGAPDSAPVPAVPATTGPPSSLLPLLGNGGDGGQDPTRGDPLTFGAGEARWYWDSLSGFATWLNAYALTTDAAAAQQGALTALATLLGSAPPGAAVASLVADTPAATAWITGGTAFANGFGQGGAFRARAGLRNHAVFVPGTLRLGASTPLSGTALIVVGGDLLIDDDFSGDLRGIVYVAGNCVITGAFDLTGTLVVCGHLTIGTGSKVVTIRHDPETVRLLKRSLERYRLSRSLRPGWAIPR